jgi:hypothetical protein
MLIYHAPTIITRQIPVLKVLHQKDDGSFIDPYSEGLEFPLWITVESPIFLGRKALSNIEYSDTAFIGKSVSGIHSHHIGSRFDVLKRQMFLTLFNRPSLSNLVAVNAHIPEGSKVYQCTETMNLISSSLVVTGTVALRVDN